MTPPFCTPTCCCHDFAKKLEATSAMLADMIKQRDALIKERDFVVAQLGA